MDDKRKQGRIPAEIKAEVTAEEGFTFSTTVNISDGGVFISTPEPYGPGTELSLDITINKEEFQMKGIVKWIREDESETDRSGMGVQFLDIDDESIKKLKSLI